jgi:hypothetical protein
MYDNGTLLWSIGTLLVVWNLTLVKPELYASWKDQHTDQRIWTLSVLYNLHRLC